MVASRVKNSKQILNAFYGNIWTMDREINVLTYNASERYLMDYVAPSQVNAIKKCKPVQSSKLLFQ